MATGWTVWVQKPCGGENFQTRPDRPWGPIQPPIQRVPGLSRGVKQRGRGVDHPPSSSADVAPHLGLRGLLYGELYLYLYQYFYSYCPISTKLGTIPHTKPPSISDFLKHRRMERCHFLMALTDAALPGAP